MENKVRVLLLGAAFSADLHADGYSRIRHKVEIVAIADKHESRIRKLANRYGLQGYESYSTFEQAIEEADCDLVDICLPNFLHHAPAVLALKKGRNIICEKPFATSYEEGKKAVECANKHKDVVAVIGFNYRNIPAIKYMNKLIEEGRIGKVFTCRQELGGNRIANPTDVKLEWRMQQQFSGPGALADFGCHMLDLADQRRFFNNKARSGFFQMNKCLKNDSLSV